MKKLLSSICCLIFILSPLSSQQEKTDSKKGGSFNFENYQSSTQNPYSEIDQTKIKALKLSFREIYDTVTVNNFLFNPKTKEGNRISLAGLLFWAVKEGNIPVYAHTDPYNSEFLAEQISWGDIIKENIPETITGLVFDSQKDSIIFPIDIDPEEIRSYLLLEASFYDLNNQVTAVRPIGLCPIRTNMDEAIGKNIRRQLFWVYFPDIMNMLSNYIPEGKIKGVKTTLDFFTKNRYMGDYFKFYHTNSPLLEGQLSGDTARFVQGFDVDWIYKRINEGFFVNPYDRFYQGLGEKEILPPSDLISEHDINPALVACEKDVYKTINLRDKENYPLYFPESTFFTQKSLIDVIYKGVKDSGIIAYQPFEQQVRMTLSEVEEAMGKSLFCTAFQNIDGASVDTTFWIEFISSEVKKYIIKEREFYNERDVLIGSEIVGLIPVREYFELSTERDTSKQLFYVPFNNAAVRKLLSENYAYRFTIDDNYSFLEFFLDKKFKVESATQNIPRLGD